MVHNFKGKSDFWTLKDLEFIAVPSVRTVYIKEDITLNHVNHTSNMAFFLIMCRSHRHMYFKVSYI